MQFELSPFNLFKTDKREFLQKKCALCISALYYPEAGNKMPSCRKLECGHAFHFDCLHQMIVSGHHKCPECREPVTKIINMDKSLEIAIRNDAFDNGDIDETLKKQFSNEVLIVNDYPYHKAVFERWRNEVTENEVTENEVGK